MNSNRENIVDIFRKFSVQRWMRKNMIHDIIDEINDYYMEKYISKEEHDISLCGEMEEYIKRLENLNVGGSSDYAQGFKKGVEQALAVIKKG